jgi:hypothetical protein
MHETALYHILRYNLRLIQPSSGIGYADVESAQTLTAIQKEDQRMSQAIGQQSYPRWLR